MPPPHMAPVPASNEHGYESPATARESRAGTAPNDAIDYPLHALVLGAMQHFSSANPTSARISFIKLPTSTISLHEDGSVSETLRIPDVLIHPHLFGLTAQCHAQRDPRSRRYDKPCDSWRGDDAQRPHFNVAIWMKAVSRR